MANTAKLSPRPLCFKNYPYTCKLLKRAFGLDEKLRMAAELIVLARLSNSSFKWFLNGFSQTCPATPDLQFPWAIVL